MQETNTSNSRRAWSVAAARSVLLAWLLMAAPAQAQIEEIVVTAQKVEENVQDVPIAVTALSGDLVAESGVTSLENLGDLVPSLTFRQGTTMANNALFLRGVGTISFGSAVEPSVSTVIDGIVLSRSGQAFFDFFDIERIEVLRGPQGTLFGKNASAGLINIVSKGGTDSFEADLNLAAYEGKEYRTKMSISGPLTEGLTGRLSGGYGSYDGNITNTFNGEKVNGYERYATRGLLDWEPNETARIRVIADYFKADDDCCNELAGASRGAILDAELNLPNGVAIGEDQRFVNSNLTSNTEGSQTSLTVQGDFDVFKDHVFTAIAGYRTWENIETREGDFLPRPIAENFELHDVGVDETDQNSLELRLASDQTNRLTYQLGAFYFKSDNKNQFTRRDVTCATSLSPVDPRTGARPCDLSDTVNTLFPTANSVSDVNVENYALFGQATYNVTDKLRLTAGLRWTHDAVDYIHFRAPSVNATNGTPAVGPGVSALGAGGLIASGGNGTNTTSDSSTNDNVSGKAVIQYDLADRVMAYASFTRGYKGPAFNVFFNHTRPTNSTPIDEESSDAYEVGLKSRLADDRIQLNAAAFQVTYEGYQAANFVLLNNTLITNLTNAGTVRSSGLEVDALANPIAGWELNASVAYTDSKVLRFNPNPLTNAPNAADGTSLPLAPEWNYVLGTNYEKSLESMGAKAIMYLGAFYKWTDEQYSELGEAGLLDSYDAWNASIGFSDLDDKYRLTFIARNITDTSYIQLSISGGTRLQIPREADSYFGATFSAKFR